MFVAQPQVPQPPVIARIPAPAIAGATPQFPLPKVRIRVYLYGENPDKTSPHHHVSKSTAARWHDWGTHCFISKHAIQERYPEPFRAVPGRVIPPIVARYSPDKLPPLELPQVHFVEPQSSAWREAHRSVTFAQACNSR